MIEIPFKEDWSAQKRLAKVGGLILIKPNGMPVFKFKSKEAFLKYKELGEKEASENADV